MSKVSELLKLVGNTDADGEQDSHIEFLKSMKNEKEMNKINDPAGDINTVNEVSIADEAARLIKELDSVGVSVAKNLIRPAKDSGDSKLLRSLDKVSMKISDAKIALENAYKTLLKI